MGWCLFLARMFSWGCTVLWVFGAGTAAWISSMRTMRCWSLVSADVVTLSPPQVASWLLKHLYICIILEKQYIGRAEVREGWKGTSSPFCQVGDIPGVRFKVVKASLYLFSWYIFKRAKCHTFVLDFVFYFRWIILVILHEQRSRRWQDVAWVPCTGTRRTLYGLAEFGCWQIAWSPGLFLFLVLHFLSGTLQEKPRSWVNGGKLGFELGRSLVNRETDRDIFKLPIAKRRVLCSAGTTGAVNEPRLPVTFLSLRGSQFGVSSVIWVIWSSSTFKLNFLTFFGMGVCYPLPKLWFLFFASCVTLTGRWSRAQDHIPKIANDRRTLGRPQHFVHVTAWHVISKLPWGVTGTSDDGKAAGTFWF